MNLPPWLTNRRVVLLAVVVLVLPTVVSGVGHVAASDRSNAVADPSAPPVDDLTLVTSQGRSPEVVSDPGGIEIINTTSRERVWAHDRDECMRYYDAEPIDNSTVLITANCRLDGGNRMRLAFEHDWRTNETGRVFRIPWDTHDVDRIGPHEYAVADIQDQRAYVYNYTAGDAMDDVSFEGREVKDSWRGDHAWSFDFTEHYPEHHGGEEGYDGDYTHLNDVDLVYDGTAFLLSPRDFNRVVVVNRSDGDVRWTLGSQGDVTVIRGQHHPVLLETDPTTVLVGDSLNHRVIEYRWVEDGIPSDATDSDAADGHWEQTWSYRTGLNWPRAVDRLPNGNTLITDSGNDRVVEVSPNGTVIWEYNSMANPYEAERYVYGDEPQGPTMATVRATNETVTNEAGQGSVSVVEHYHRLAGWVLPVWVGEWAFIGLVLAAAVSVGWVVTEIGLVVYRLVREHGSGA